MSNPPSEGSAESTVRLDRADPYLRLQSVTIFVRDLERSLDFYVNRLGFELAFDARIHLKRAWVVVSPPDGPSNLVLVAPEPGSEQFKLIGQSNLITFITEDLLAKFREWTGRGVKFNTPRLRRLTQPSKVRAPEVPDSASSGDAPPVWGGAITRFRDPDGNALSLAAFDDVTRAIEAQRRAMSEKLEAERRAAQELEIATQVQARLLPKAFPSLKSLEFAGLCLQARHVGGDYYDFLNLGNDRLGLVIGDISGKGIAAALLMANLQANLRSQCAMAQDPRRLLCAVNQLFCQNTADASFATLFFGEFDASTRRLRYANCGHLPPLLLRSDDTVARLPATATVVGAFERWDCSLEECQLCSGDTLALYTDGITESFNGAGEEFGEENLIDTLRRHRHLSSQDLLAAVVDEVRRFSPQEQRDDITLIIARCLPS